MPQSERSGPDEVAQGVCVSRADRIRTTDAIRPVVFDAHNLRVKIYEIEHPREVIETSLLADAERQGLTKAIVYARPGSSSAWERECFRQEGTISGFFADGSDAAIQSRFLDPDRAHSAEHPEHERIVRIALDCEQKEASLPPGLLCEIATPADADGIAELMGETFSDYPDPISPEWVVESIEERSRQFRIVRNDRGRVIASASAEIDHRRRSAELTDCATAPEARGRGVMRAILAELENDMLAEGIRDLYTLARSDELPMNCAFAKMGWSYGGRLVNNCRMPNGWESMNIWCRSRA